MENFKKQLREARLEIVELKAKLKNRERTIKYQKNSMESRRDMHESLKWLEKSNQYFREENARLQGIKQRSSSYVEESGVKLMQTG